MVGINVLRHEKELLSPSDAHIFDQAFQEPKCSYGLT